MLFDVRTIKYKGKQVNWISSKDEAQEDPGC